MTEDRPTLDTVAKLAGVSRMTVSNAYNRPDQLSAATRERVLLAAEELGYPGPDPAGRSLRRGRSGAVGVLLAEGLGYSFTDPGLVSFMRGLAGELGAAGQAMLMVPAESDADGSLVRSAIVDAFILCAMDERDPAVSAVRARRLPIVTAGRIQSVRSNQPATFSQRSFSPKINARIGPMTKVGRQMPTSASDMAE